MGGQVGDVGTIDRHRSQIGPLKARSNPQCRGLAATTGPQQANQFALAQNQIKTFQRNYRAEGFADTLKNKRGHWCSFNFGAEAIGACSEPSVFKSMELN